MKIYDLKEYLKQEKKGDIRKLYEAVLGGKKNQALRLFRDYYNGIQWSRQEGNTQHSRDGREIWKVNSNDVNDLGVNNGDLQVWNVCRPSVDVYASYGRGSTGTDNQIVIEGDEVKTQEVNQLVNLDQLISRTITRASVDSATVWKRKADKTLEFVDAMEVAPVYDGEDMVGFIRVYEISGKHPLVEKVGKAKKYVYTEVWHYIDDKLWLDKFVNEDNVESGEAPYDQIPYIIVSNKDNEFMKFDENSTENSDVGDIIPLQNTINKIATEEGIIISKVAFPMVRVMKEVYEAVLAGKIDGTALKEDLSRLSLMAGKILMAPIEVESGVGVPAGIEGFFENIYQQLYRVTGIPKAVYVSDGIGNISEGTMQNMMESLKRKVDEKRANVEKGIKTWVAMIYEDPTLYDKTEVKFAEMFETSIEGKSNILMQAKQHDVLPDKYVIEKVLELLGDADRLKDVMSEKMADDIDYRLEIEKSKIRAEEQKRSAQAIEAERQARERERERVRQLELDKSLLENELETITSI